MAVYPNMVITNQGVALYAKVQAGAALNFTRMQIGSGQLGSGQDPATLTALITPISFFAINSMSTTGNTAHVKGIFENTNINSNTYSCELGLFATDPNIGEILYAYANAGAQGDNIPPISAGPFAKQYQINSAVGNATNVTASIPAMAYAPLNSPSLTGDPTTPTPAANDNDTSIANTTWVKARIDAAINALINSAPVALDTLYELAAALGNDPNFAATMTSALAAKAPKDSPIFSGPVTLALDPVSALQAVTKQYADAIKATADAASTKQYVDNLTIFKIMGVY
jgi:hypothetical protein